MASAALPAAGSPAAAGAELRSYRRDIDGLRAIAVVPVVLFHAGVSGFGGGFVGVDVFFVISGYLITSIIWRELGEGRLSLLGFYERRVRRIAPALVVLLLAVLATASLLFLPRDFERIPAAVAATLGFFSNVLFYTQSDYFDAPSRWNPLVHTWSLAIEEQYYLLFPLFVAILFRHARRLVVPAIAGLALLSFVLNLWTAPRSPTFTFFMAPTRVWELLFGSLLAVGLVPAARSAALRETAAATGVLLIGTAVLTVDESMPFPGWAGLLPVLGAALVIHCGRATATDALLSLPVLRSIGLVSYSLYLWHWPVLVFAEYGLGRPLQPAEVALAIALSFGVAAASWRFVEQPFRRRGVIGRRTLFRFAGLATIVVAGLAALSAATDGWPSRFSAPVLRLEAAADDVSPRRRECGRTGSAFVPIERSCVYGAAVPPSVAIWGDSHSLELAQVLGERAAPRGVGIVSFSAPGCGPLLTAQRRLVRDCLPYSRAVMRYLQRHPELRTVILVMRTDRDEFRADPALAEDFVRSARRLAAAGRRVAIVHPVPTQSAPVPRLLAMRARAGKSLDTVGVPLQDFLERNRDFLRRLDELQGARFFHVRPAATLCRDGVCRAWLAGRPLYHDDNHLGMNGARLVAPLFDPILLPAGR